MIELLFAFIVTVAVIAVLFDPETGGLIVMTIAMMAAFWQLAEIVGPEPWLAIFAVFVAAAFYIMKEGMDAGWFELSPLAIRVLDAVLTRMGYGGGGPPQTPQRGDRQEVQQRRMPRQRRQAGPVIFTDQEEDDEDEE